VVEEHAGRFAPEQARDVQNDDAARREERAIEQRVGDGVGGGLVVESQALRASLREPLRRRLGRLFDEEVGRAADQDDRRAVLERREAGGVEGSARHGRSLSASRDAPTKKAPGSPGPFSRNAAKVQPSRSPFSESS